MMEGFDLLVIQFQDRNILLGLAFTFVLACAAAATASTAAMVSNYHKTFYYGHFLPLPLFGSRLSAYPLTG